MKQNKILMFLILIVQLSFNSCTSQKTLKEELLGNWYTLKNNDVTEITYTEIYIDKDNIYYYTDDFGLKPPSQYFLEGNQLFHTRLGSQKEKLGELRIEKNTFSIISNGNIISFKRLNDVNKLGDFLNGEINEEVYRNAFLGRLSNW